MINHGLDQFGGGAGIPEAADHDGGTVLKIGDGLHRAGHGLVNHRCSCVENLAEAIMIKPTNIR